MWTALWNLTKMRKVAAAVVTFLAGLAALTAALAAGALDAEKYSLSLAALAGWLGKAVIEGIAMEDAALKTGLPPPAAPLPMVVGLPGQPQRQP